jgi:hypothetical protein
MKMKTGSRGTLLAIETVVRCEVPRGKPRLRPLRLMPPQAEVVGRALGFSRPPAAVIFLDLLPAFVAEINGHVALC